MNPLTLRRPRWPAPPKEAGVSSQKEGYPAPPGALSNQPRAVPGAAGCADAQSDEQRCGSSGLVPTRHERHVWQLTLREAKEARKDSFLKRTILKTSLLLGVERQIYFYVVIKKEGNALLWLQAYTYLRNKEWHKQGNICPSAWNQDTSASFIIVSCVLSYVFHTLPRNAQSIFVNSSNAQIRKSQIGVFKSHIFHMRICMLGLTKIPPDASINRSISQPFYKQTSNMWHYGMLWYCPVSPARATKRTHVHLVGPAAQQHSSSLLILPAD